MGFRLVPKSVTLNDPERRSGPYFAFNYFEFSYKAFGAHYVKVVDSRSTESLPRNVIQYTNEARRTRCALRVSGLFVHG